MLADQTAAPLHALVQVSRQKRGRLRGFSIRWDRYGDRTIPLPLKVANVGYIKAIILHRVATVFGGGEGYFLLDEGSSSEWTQTGSKRHQ